MRNHRVPGTDSDQESLLNLFLMFGERYQDIIWKPLNKHPLQISSANRKAAILKYGLYILVLLCSLSIAAQNTRNFQTSIGLGIGPSIPTGSFRSKDIYSVTSGFASDDYTGFKFILEQNLGKFVGVSMNFYSMYHTFDVAAFEQSVNINNRGLAPDLGLQYKFHHTESQWEVSVGNIGMYYHRQIGPSGKLYMKGILSATITEMISPEMVVDIMDSSNTVLQVRTIEGAQSWREVFLAPPIDGISLEINAQYFFSKHFAIRPSVIFINSTGWYDGTAKALINMPKVHYQAINYSLGISYTFFYQKD